MININNLHKSFGDLEVLKGINADIDKGRVVCLIGPSGSGKSTLLRCVNGLERYQRGSIVVDGVRVDVGSPTIHELRARLSMVFQRFNLFPNRTALENVIEGPVHVLREDKRAARDRATELLRLVGLQDKTNCYPSSLSGGQQQRVAIARALAMQPKAILFDEPTSALDPEMVGDVLQVMRRLAEQHMTMLVVTHEMQFAREVADTVLFLEGGRILEQGDAKEMLQNPSQERTRDFLRRVTHPI
ncbi:amino acid ABC transporter ATP-binding protein, PAAT family [Rhizobiales bacterium GAS188]|nr:amino acid ABC transporter ATP-binding protein, PAAT family [Rhizobiales bacterium GAS188]